LPLQLAKLSRDLHYSYRPTIGFIGRIIFMWHLASWLKFGILEYAMLSRDVFRLVCYFVSLTKKLVVIISMKTLPRLNLKYLSCFSSSFAYIFSCFFGVLGYSSPSWLTWANTYSISSLLVAFFSDIFMKSSSISK